MTMPDRPLSKDLAPGTQLRWRGGSIVKLECRKSPDDGRTRGIPFHPGWWLTDNQGGLADFAIDNPEIGWEVVTEPGAEVTVRKVDDDGS